MKRRASPSSLARVWAALDGLKSAYRAEILVVDDGSTDRTGELAEAFAAGHPEVRVSRHSFNLRLGQALRGAFHESRGDIVVVMDADLSYSPEIIEALLRRMRETRAKIVIASPYRKGGAVRNVPRGRRWLSRWANRFLCRMATRDRFSDKLTNITGMVRAYDGSFIRGLSLWAMDVDINAEIINKAKILRARIVEIPAVLDWGPRAPAGRKRGKGGMETLRTVVQSLVSGFLFRPFMFFIWPGLMLLVLVPLSPALDAHPHRACLPGDCPFAILRLPAFGSRGGGLQDRSARLYRRRHIAPGGRTAAQPGAAGLAEEALFLRAVHPRYAHAEEHLRAGGTEPSAGRPPAEGVTACPIRAPGVRISPSPS